MKPSAKQEEEFFNALLDDLDNSFWNAAPSSPLATPQKVKHSQPQTPKRGHSDTNVFSVNPEDVDLEALTQGAEDWDWEADLSSPQRSPVKSGKRVLETPATGSRPTFTRCIVERVVELGGRKELTVKVEKSQEKRLVVLCDDWSFIDIQKGDVASVVGSFETVAQSTSSITSSITINAQTNLLILHPDVLLTPTALANALQCRRKPLLAHLVRNPMGESSPSLVWGSMLHLVVQSCLASGQWSDAFINQTIDEVIAAGLLDLIKVRVDVGQAKREIYARAKGLRTFAERYIADFPKPTASLTNTRASRSQSATLAISHFYDSEEDIWSPEYGLKGKVDATVQAVISEMLHPQLPPSISSQTLPFEIKTGRAVAGMEHRAQTMLYALLIAERYGVEVPSGLLYYTQNEEVVNVPVGRNEIRGLMIVRNEMATYMMTRYRSLEKGFSPDAKHKADVHLPPTINDERICKRCDLVDTCMLYRKAIEHVDDDDSPISDTYAVNTGHLTPSQCAFFEKWEALISLEEQDLLRYKTELWTMNASERETKGRCFSSMIIDHTFTPPSLQSSNSLNGKIHKFTYKFVRRLTPSGNLINKNSLLNGHLGIGDAITVSAEPHLLAYAQGFIVDLTHQSVTVGIDHELDPDTLRQG
ncbi:hypothetical protein ONZ45_g17286 [Pleurotus djamor]|nr:hypothetical protein ONZ45_g17286 [Pleurotus djamor]